MNRRRFYVKSDIPWNRETERARMTNGFGRHRRSHNNSLDQFGKVNDARKKGCTWRRFLRRSALCIHLSSTSFPRKSRIVILCRRWERRSREIPESIRFARIAGRVVTRDRPSTNYSPLRRMKINDPPAIVHPYKSFRPAESAQPL